MAMTNLSIQMDEALEKDFELLCESIGISVAAAVCIFAKKAVTEQRIPFALTANSDPFFSEANQQHLDRVIRGIEDGTAVLTEHALLEDDT